MKKIYSLMTIFLLLSLNINAATEIDKKIEEIKKEFSIGESKIEGNFKNATYELNNTIQTGNTKKILIADFKNNSGSQEEYYIKDDKVYFIFVRKLTVKNDGKDYVEEKESYYFDDNQKLIRYLDKDNKKHDAEAISQNIIDKAENLKKEIKLKTKTVNSKEEILKMQKEFDVKHREMLKQMDDMKKEMQAFFESF